MILITGGAGYIGSHCTLDLIRAGYECVVIDNLSYGHPEAIQQIADKGSMNDESLLKQPCFCKVDLKNIDEIKEVFKKYPIKAVIHFAAFAYVGESVENPQKYYYNNVVNTLNLLSVMLENNVKKIVFSSTCATYGNPEYVPIDEKHPQSPINPYGTTKLMIEKILKDYDSAYELKYIALRYFNASGADDGGQLNAVNIGESHSPETHLIPLVLQTALGQRDCIKVFGDDYDTPDGTCIRDYIHVNDLAKAHRLALEKLIKEEKSNFYNLGTGKGFSVKEVIEKSEKITGKLINKQISERREGDPPVLIADNKKVKQELGWNPEYTEIEDIIKTAWNWELNRKY
ncbi:MAG: UDP-glucose 4-epimerase GalE [bacterium]